MWNEEKRGVVMLVGLLGTIVLIAYLFSEIISNGLTMPTWSQTANSELPFFCLPADNGPVGCFREWIDPVAAVFTVAAIIFAARQVFEANRQSDAAVRTSLLAMKASFDAERVNANRALVHFRHALGESLRLHGQVDLDDFDVEPVIGLIANLREFPLHEVSNVVRMHTGAGTNPLDDFRTRFGAQLIEYEISVRYGLDRDEASFLPPTDGPGFEKLFTADIWRRRQAKRFLQQTSATLRKHIGGKTALSEYLHQLTAEIAIINEAIFELDRDVLTKARARHAHHNRESNKRLHEALKESNEKSRKWRETIDTLD